MRLNFDFANIITFMDHVITNEKLKKNNKQTNRKKSEIQKFDAIYIDCDIF